MITLASPMIFISDILRAAGAARRDKPAATKVEQDENRARRDFMLEMLDLHPEAFASDHSVQSMLSLYRERF